MTTDDRDREAKLETARTYMSIRTIQLQKHLTPLDTAGVLIGAAVGVLETHFDRDTAADYLAELALEMRNEDDTGAPTVGHA